MKYLSNINLSKNELQNAVIQNLGTDPAVGSSKEGQIYFNTVTDKLRVFDGTAWVDVSSPMTGADIVTAINGSAGTIDLDNLAASVGTAVTNSHTHSNKTTLDNITAAYTTAEQTKLSGIESGADVTDAANVKMAIDGTTAKTSLVDADEVTILNSASANVLSTITYANLKTTLKTYTDTLYNNYAHPSGDGNLHVPATSTTNNGKVLTAGATAGSLSWTTPTTGTVTSVAAGNGLNFTTITGSGSVTLGTPSSLNGGTTNAVTTTSHTHAVDAATTSVAGFMSAADKTKLDGIASGANAYTHPNHSGDVTSVADGATTIANSAVTNAKMANMANNTIKGNVSGAAAAPSDLTAAQVKTMIGMVLTETANATGFSLAGGSTSKTLTMNNSLTLAGTDATTMTFPSTSASIARIDAAQSFTGNQTFNDNISADNVVEGYTTTATAAGTTTLTVSSMKQQYFTGTSTQTVVLPVTSTLVLGHKYEVVNSSTGAVTVQSSGANTIVVLAGGTSAVFTCILTSGTTAASWSYWYKGDSIASGKKLTVSNSITLAGNDGSTLTIGGGGALGSAAYTATTAYEAAITSGTANYVWGMNAAGNGKEFKQLTVGSTGTAPAIVHSAGGIAFNIPLASGTGVTSGTLTKTDYDKIHTQNTDAGTSSATFYVGTSGPKLKNNSGVVEFRNNADNAYADIKCKDLTVDGTLTTINSNEVNIGDSNLLLNADITTSAQNSNGGLSVKRLMADNVTRKDAVIEFDDSTGAWKVTDGAVAGTLVTSQVARKLTFSVGDGTNTSYTLTHNLNTRDLTVAIRETAGSYENVFTDIAYTTVNTITVTFAVAPTSGQYTATIIG